MNEDLPTFDFPAKAISGAPKSGNLPESATETINSAFLMTMAFLSPLTADCAAERSPQRSSYLVYSNSKPDRKQPNCRRKPHRASEAHISARGGADKRERTA